MHSYSEVMEFFQYLVFDMYVQIDSWELIERA